MSDSPRSIGQLFQDTVARRGDQPALGLIRQGRLEWLTWASLDRDFVQPRAKQIREANAQTVAETAPNSVEAIATHLAASIVGVTTVSPGEAPPTVDGSRPAALVRTSGTSGAPRWVALSSENLASNAIAVADAILAGSYHQDEHDEVRLSFLPYTHLYARVCDLFAWVYRGSRLVLAESRETIFRDCGLVRPTSISGVPYFFQKVLDRSLAECRSIQDILGGRTRQCFCGGAALASSVQRAFADQGVSLLNGYGLTEASPVVTVSTQRENKIGTVGKPLPGVEVRLADDGEVLVRGSNVMLGYRGDVAATADTLRNGWLHTGDLGAIDQEGYLSITGRKKELLALATGKKVSPGEIEAQLSASPWIEQACVVGEGRKFLSALIVPNPERVRAEVRRRRLWVWSKRRALNHPAIREVFAGEIERCVAGCESAAPIGDFTLLGRGFSVERGEMTEKLSLRRAAIAKTLSAEIERLYATSAR